MSILIKGMEMPENCDVCRFRVNNSTTNVPNWICAVNQWPTFYCKKSKNRDNEDKYLQDCPIICVLSEGHGRLIDADALAHDLEFDVELDERALDDMDFVGKERERVEIDRDCKQECLQYLSDAPTIIEAEEGKE